VLLSDADNDYVGNYEEYSDRLSVAPALLRATHSLNLLEALHWRQPVHSVLHEQLPPRPQLRLMQMEIVHGADAQDAEARERRADAVHERAARRAEVVGHGAARADCARLAEGREVLAAAQVLQVRVGDGEVGREHGRGDLAAVGAVAEEGTDQARA
jgi:hypothetical protein